MKNTIGRTKLSNLINMNSMSRRILIRVLSSRISCVVNSRTFNYLRNNHVNITSQLVNLGPVKLFYDPIRCKSKKYDSDDENVADNDSSLSRDSKVVKFSTTSMRTDMILKSALGVSRNKIEQAFYESNIRVNGKKITKKSASVRIGDEIDLIKMVSPKNPDHLYVSRVEILDASPKDESIGISARRFKNLLIENYDEDPHKGGSVNSS